MASRVQKSLFWLGACSGLGYLLLLITTPNKEIQKEFPGIEKSMNKKQQFANVLEAAATINQPIYRMNKEQLDRELQKK